jgi:hypothetical protein
VKSTALKIRARVKQCTGATAHFEGELHDDEVVQTRRYDPAAVAEIQQTENGFFLVRFTATGDFAGDTWHATLDEAKEQATFEFELDEEGWVDAAE